MNNIADIIIIGTCHHNTLSMIRCFGEAGYSVMLIIYGTEQRSYVESSVYVRSTHRTNTADGAFGKLCEILKDATEKPVVISCSDEIESIIDDNYDTIKDSCYCFNGGQKGQVNYFMDKQHQARLAQECDFLVPNSVETYPTNADINSVSYPCLVKPKESIHGGKHIVICKNYRELETSLALFEPHNSVLIQDLIQKEYEIVILGVTIAGQSFIPGYIKKHRECKGGTTYASVLPISDIPECVINSTRKFVYWTKYEGLWGLECIKANEGFYFLELNMRNDATTYAMAEAGVNLPVLYYDCVQKGKLVIQENICVSPIKSIVEFEDVVFPLKGKMSLIRWYSQFKNAECKYFYSKMDPQPYQIRKKEFIKFLRKKILHF